MAICDLLSLPSRAGLLHAGPPGLKDDMRTFAKTLFVLLSVTVAGIPQPAFTTEPSRSFRAVHVQTDLRARLRLWQADDRDPLQTPGFHLPRRLLPQAVAVRLAMLAKIALR